MVDVHSSGGYVHDANAAIQPKLDRKGYTPDEGSGELGPSQPPFGGFPDSVMARLTEGMNGSSMSGEPLPPHVGARMAQALIDEFPAGGTSSAFI